MIGRNGEVWHGTENGMKTGFAMIYRRPEGQLPLAWSVEIGPGYTGPTVANGRVFVMDKHAEDRNASERILCFDSATVVSFKVPVA